MAHPIARLYLAWVPRPALPRCALVALLACHGCADGSATGVHPFDGMAAEPGAAQWPESPTVARDAGASSPEPRQLDAASLSAWDAGRFGTGPGPFPQASEACVASVRDSHDAGPTKGPIPADQFSGGSINWSLVPDYIPALARDGGVAGYISKCAVSGIGGADIPVFDESLQILVGHMVPGRGFVPLGTAPEDVPEFPVVVSDYIDGGRVVLRSDAQAP